MHIKQLTISGFKSYRDQVVVEPFSPGCNIVVGRNGAGKSNFFSAIRFVLNDAYSKLDSEERSSLLHEGAGQPALSAYVEIVFDNSDNRFPTGREEVVLRRTIGLKKDEYSLDHKIITYTYIEYVNNQCSKSDVMNLLQSAGFSRSNPYYIVPQGRITALCNAKDSDRLALLKEVAGTRVYEEHRAESVKILEETDRKREKIVELLQMITERLSELEEERAELEEFLEVDKERKAVEYCLLNRQLSEATKAIDGLDEEERQLVADMQTFEKERHVVESQLAQLSQIEAQLSEEKQQLEEALREKSLMEVERDQLIKQVTQLEMACADAEAVTVKQQKVIEKELKAVASDLVKREREQDKLDRQLSQHTADQDTLKRQLDEATAKQSGLRAKQSRSNQFKSASERDKWIRQETASLHTTIDLSRRQLATLEEEAKSAEARHADLQARHQEKTDEYDTLLRQQQEHQHAYKQVKERRDQVVEARKEGWRTEAKLEQTMRTVKEEVDRWERTLAYSMDRAVFAGLQNLASLVTRLGLQGRVFGPVCDLFTCDAVYRTAVESVAGNSLFHVVVADDEAAVELMECMYKEQLGRLTFIPINTASIDTDVNTEDLRLLDKLVFEERFKPVMANIFQNTVIVPDLSTASRDAVTLNGDRQSRRGTVTGGWHDPKRSRLEAVCRLKEWRDRQQSCQEQLTAVRQKLSALDQSMCQLTSQLHILERQQSAQLGAGELQDSERDLKNALDIVQLKTRTIATVSQRIAAMQSRVDQLEAELGRPLTEADASGELLQLETIIEQLCQQYDKMSAEESVIRAQCAACNDAIVALKAEQVNLLERLSTCTRLQADSVTLQTSHAALQSTMERIHSLVNNIDEHEDAIRRLEEAMEKAQSLLLTAASAGKSDSAMERFLSRRAHLLSERDDVNKKLRDLGVVSEDAVRVANQLGNHELLERLHSLSTACRQRFAHVNKRAREQSLQYHKQSDELSKRKHDLDASAAAITDFICSLDHKKDEAIMRTFTQVSDAFQQVFREMGGDGNLEIVREADDLSGVAVLVRSFGHSTSAVEGDQQEVNVKQLSGGQKSLIALSLILAIQRVDPAPFYLFDEVDAALDAHHRAALARLLSADTASRQYVITTFRPELVAVGQQWWGVSGGGGGSRIDPITRDVALQFIEHV